MNTPVSPSLPAAATPSWHVLGVGAIGGLWALRMAAAGIRVTLLSHRNAAASRRLTLQDGERVMAHDFPQQSVNRAGPVTRLLVTTKSNLTASALAPLLPWLAPGTPLLLLQNGMGADDALQAQRPDLALLVGITTDGVWRRDADTLVQAGQGETLLGAYDSKDEAAAAMIAAELAATGAGIRLDEGIRLRRWEKLAMNCAINPLTALYRCRNGELLEKPEALAQMRQIADEVAPVMRAEGMPVSADVLYQRICQAAEKTAANISSMHADVAAGRATEIAFINGYLVARAAQHGLDVPLNRRLLADILALPQTAG